MAANKHNASIQTTTKAVHQETVRIVDEQMRDISNQMQALDDFVTRAKSQNGQHHDSHVQSLQNLSSTVKNSYDNIGQHFTVTYDRIKGLGDDMSSQTNIIQEVLAPLNSDLKDPLSRLRSNITSTILQEYVPTGETPRKIQYEFPTTLPRTDDHETLLERLRNPGAVNSPIEYAAPPVVYHDAPAAGESMIRPTTSSSDASDKSSVGTLREVSVNTIRDGAITSGGEVTECGDVITEIPVPMLKKSLSGMRIPQKVGAKKGGMHAALEGREKENAIPVFSQSTGRRRSPRGV